MADPTGAGELIPGVGPGAHPAKVPDGLGKVPGKPQEPGRPQGPGMPGEPGKPAGPEMISKAEYDRVVNELEKEKAKKREEQKKEVKIDDAAVKTAPKDAEFPMGEYGERLPLQTLTKRQLDKTMGRWVSKWVEPGPQQALGYGKEKRRPNWFRRMFLKIPFLGFLPPEGMTTLPNGASTVEQFYNSLKTATGAVNVGAVAGATKDIMLSTISPALTVGALGALTRGAVDGIRWAVMKEKTVDTLVRELVRRGTNGRRSWDQAAVWKIVFNDKPDVAQLLDLGRELKSGATADQLMMDKSEIRRLIKKAFGVKLDQMAMERIMPSEFKARLTEAERLQLDDINTAYGVADQLFREGLSPAERAAFLQDELPNYLERREFTNHLKSLVVRSGIAGFKTSIVGAGVSLFKGLSKVGLLADWGKRISDTVTGGYESTANYVGTWWRNASKGLINWLNTKNIAFPNFAPAAAPAGAGAAAANAGAAASGTGFVASAVEAMKAKAMDIGIKVPLPMPKGIPWE